MQIKSDIVQHLVDKSDLNWVNMNLLNNISEHIWQLGNLLNPSSELPEWVIMDRKQVYHQSNLHEAAIQILQMESYNEVFQFWEVNPITRKQCRDDEFPLTNVPIKQIMHNSGPEIMTHNDLAKGCRMPKPELQNHIAWCFNRFANFTDYIDHYDYFICLNNAKYIQYNAVACQVTSFQIDKQEIHMVRCTVCTRWGKYKPPRNDTLFLTMGKSPESNFQLTDGCNHAQLKCLFIMEDTESFIEELVVLLQSFPTGLIRQTTGMAVVEERYEPPMQPLYNWSNHCMPLFLNATTYIVLISTIKLAVHLYPLTMQPESKL